MLEIQTNAKVKNFRYENQEKTVVPKQKTNLKCGDIFFNNKLSFSCSLCNESYTFITIFEFKQHISYDHEEIAYELEYSDIFAETVEDVQLLEEHDCEEVQLLFKCGDIFLVQQTKMLYCCSICYDEFESIEEYSQHNGTHVQLMSSEQQFELTAENDITKYLKEDKECKENCIQQKVT